jgi:hypothetical protein
MTQAVLAEVLEQQQQAKQQRNSLLKGAERVIKCAIPDGSIHGSIRAVKVQQEGVSNLLRVPGTGVSN